MEYLYKAKCIRVIDGDTIEAMIDLGFNCLYHTKLRLKDVNAPEIRTKNKKEKQAGQKIKESLELIMARGEMQVKTQKTGKYGRWLADVWVVEENKKVFINEAVRYWIKTVW